MQYIFVCSYLLVMLRAFETRISRTNRPSVELVVHTEADSMMASGYKFKGVLASSRKSIYTYGRLFQLNDICTPPRLRNRSSQGWIAFIEISKQHKCHSSVRRMVKMASRRGAKAVIFDMTGNISLKRKLQHSHQKFDEPVVILAKRTSKKIVKLLKRKKKPFIKITTSERNLLTKNESKEDKDNYLDMAIFMAFFIIISLLCLLLIIKIRCRHRRKKISMTRHAVKALQEMEVKTCHYEIENNNDETNQCAFDMNNCTICLEELRQNGKDIRVLPCQHEYHKLCIDPWLIENFTCPLCMYTIVDSKKKKCKLQRRRNLLQTLLFRRPDATNETTSSETLQNLLVHTETSTRSIPQDRQKNDVYFMHPCIEQSLPESYRFRWCPRHAKKHSCRNDSSSENETFQDTHKCLKMPQSSSEDVCENYRNYSEADS